MASQPITADSQIVWCYFSTTGDCWNCADLIQWHKALINKYAQTGLTHGDAIAQANVDFINAWNQGPFISSLADCRSFSTSFRAYAKENNFFDALYDGIGILAKPLGVGTDVVDAAGNLVSNSAKGLSSFSTVVKWGLPILAIVGAGLLIWWGYKKVKGA